MNLDLSKFKKIHEDSQSATLRHPEGHKIKIAKQALSEKVQKQLSGLKMAGGGEVEDLQGYRSPGAKEEASKVIENYPVTFPAPKTKQEYLAQDQASQPELPQKEASGPPSPNATSEFESLVNKKYSEFKSMGSGMSDEQLFKNAESAVTNELSSKKDSEDVAASQKEDALKYHYEFEKSHVQAENEKRARLGLPPLAMPTPPSGGQALQVNNLVADNSAQPAMPQVTPAEPQAQSDPYGTQSYLNSYSQGLDAQKAGIQQEAQALGQQGAQDSQIYNEELKNQVDQTQKYQQHYTDLENERNNFISDYQNKHIDPTRFLKSMSTGQKITTAIGLILGGMGAGSSGENPVESFLKQQIDNDVKAQQAELGKGENLITANMRQFGNLRDATDMTRVMQMDILKTKIAEAAAKSQNPLAQARAQQAIGKLDLEAAPIMSQLAMRRSLMSSQSGMGQGSDPSMVIRMTVPEKQQNEAYKELGTAQELIKAKNTALGVFDKLSNINTIGNRISSPLQTPREVASARDNIAVQIARDEAGRVNEYEFAAAQKLFPEPGDTESTLASKRQDLLNVLQKKMNTPILNSYGINLGNTASERYSVTGQKKIQLGAPTLTPAR